jgi:hypothetical protein
MARGQLLGVTMTMGKGTEQVALKKLESEEHLQEVKIKADSEDKKRDDYIRLVRYVLGTVVVLAALGLLGSALYWNRGFIFKGLGIEASTVITTTVKEENTTTITTSKSPMEALEVDTDLPH